MLPGRRIALLLTVALAIAGAWLSRGISIDRPLPASGIQPDQGHAFMADVRVVPFLIEALADDSAPAERSATRLREDGRRLGPAHADRDRIRLTGGGAFSQRSSTLYFSASDNSDPRSNGRTYSARITAVPTTAVKCLLALLLVAAAILNRDLAIRAGRRINSRIDRIPGLRWVWFNLGPGLLISVIVLLLVGLAGEGWFRLRVRPNAKATPPVSANESPKQSEPFQKVVWPGAWNPEATFTFVPHAEIRWTNHLDFWVRQRSNAVGFADRDWDEAKPPGVIRVAFIGDSFVEALQVPIEDKLQVRFEANANRALAPKKFETAAFGMSGTGQVNQLSFYDAVARKFRPDLVVLVVIGNDFANNSAILEGVRNGWHPEHLPRLFYIRRQPSDPFHRAPLDANYASHYLPSGEGPTPTPGLRDALNSSLRQRSRFYTWFAESFKLRFPSLAAKAAHRPTQDEIYSARIAAIRKLPGYEHSLDGWNFPDDWDLDSMFAAQRLAPVFTEAIEATGFALDEFKRRGHEDGFRLVLLMTNNLAENISNAAIEKSTGNHGLERGRFARFKELADRRDIPIVDMREYLERHKIEPESLTWAHDGHWSPAGHEAVAGALLEAIQSHPEWLSP